VGRAVPLAFLLAAIGVPPVAYGFVRLCQYFHHAGSVYAFVGATLGPRTGLVSGFGLLGTYCFYGVVTSSATGIFGTVFLLVSAVFFGAEAFDTFLWSGTIGTLILLVAYLLTTIGAIRLVFVQRRMPAVPMWQVVVPVLAPVVLGYTLWRNVYPYPAYDAGPPFWFPLVAGGWLLVGLVAVLVAPAMAQRAGAALTAAELGARQEEQAAEA
jgi:hypothetical protein